MSSFNVCYQRGALSTTGEPAQRANLSVALSPNVRQGNGERRHPTLWPGPNSLTTQGIRRLRAVSTGSNSLTTWA